MLIALDAGRQYLNDSVDAVSVFMKSVKKESHISGKGAKRKSGQAQGQADDIDQRISSLAIKMSEGGFQAVPRKRWHEAGCLPGRTVAGLNDGVSSIDFPPSLRAIG